MLAAFVVAMVVMLVMTAMVVMAALVVAMVVMAAMVVFIKVVGTTTRMAVGMVTLVMGLEGDHDEACPPISLCTWCTSCYSNAV